ncbi:MAG: DUF2905 domain-containing protein [Elusimicrobiota bacterium]
MNTASRIFIVIGIILIIIGILVNFGLGRLPGDIYIKKDNFAFYFPIVSAVIVSIVISLIFLIIKR